MLYKDYFFYPICLKLRKKGIIEYNKIIFNFVLIFYVYKSIYFNFCVGNFLVNIFFIYGHDHEFYLINIHETLSFTGLSWRTFMIKKSKKYYFCFENIFSRNFIIKILNYTQIIKTDDSFQIIKI
jgi:hypothetical protein